MLNNDMSNNTIDHDTNRLPGVQRRARRGL